MKAKFKVGDIVTCAKKTTRRGAGWKNGLKFKVTGIIINNTGIIYFGGLNGNGVYEEELILKIENWRDEL